MTSKIIVPGFFLLLLLLTGCAGQAESQNADPTASASPQQQAAQSNADPTVHVIPQRQAAPSAVAKVDKVEIIDFHGTRRCFSCQTIEKFARATVEESFPAERRDGTITFQSINVEEPQNQALVQKYQARGSSLFINAIRDGEDHIAEDTAVWRLVSDEQQFKEYFKKEIATLLE